MRFHFRMHMLMDVMGVTLRTKHPTLHLLSLLPRPALIYPLLHNTFYSGFTAGYQSNLLEMSGTRESDGSDSFETESIIEDPAPTTIRIPNPKVFLARQSQWKGRRGKPRCDYCRTNNLKVPRVSLALACSLTRCLAPSVTENSPSATTVRGLASATASTRHSPPLLIGGYPGAIGAASGI